MTLAPEKSLRWASLATVVLAAATTCSVACGRPIDFNRDVRPIIANHCLHCHGPDADQRKGELRLDDAEDVYRDRNGHRVIDQNSPDKSEILARILNNDPDEIMPPPDSPNQPSADELEILRTWVEQGGEWSTHWSLVAPSRPKEPTVAASHKVRNGIDAFVIARLQAEGFTPSSEADRYTLIRRASLALTGLPPTVQQVDAFVNDKQPGAYERVVDRLLESPTYGEHMAFGWLDAARYADTSGYQADWERFMWPWRDWVVQALNDNMPYDQFTIEQLAGDMLPEPSMSQLIATGFNRNHRINDEGGSLDAEFEVEYVVDRVDTTATIWLGLTAGCARCHDHKFDPLSQREFYELYAFFNNVPEKGIDGRKGAAKPFIDVPNPLVQKKLDGKRNELKTLEEDAEKNKDAIATLEKAMEKLKKKATTPVMVMQELPERKPTYLLKRGEYDQPDRSENLKPMLPAVFRDDNGDSPKTRLELARWLVSPKNPLAARAAVNRLWQHHFGIGLVKTSEDFGSRGDAPSHPELLDWLATEFVRLGWDVKAMHRLIVTSATFRQSSNRIAQNDRDLNNRLLGRGPRKRLSGPAIRDQALSVSGLLCRTMGGPPVKPYQPPGLWKELSFGTGKTSVDFYVQDDGDALYRRGLYTFWKRTVAPPRMAVFDGTGREMCRVRSDTTNTPLQALTLQNDVTFVEAARHLAERMMKETENPDDALTMGWRVVVARPPTAKEMTTLRGALNRHLAIYGADLPAAKELLSFGESPRDASLSAEEHAAFTIVALSILNLDETITLE